MSRPFGHKVLTANDLLEGDVIYLDLKGAWTRELHLAALFGDEPSASGALAQIELRPGVAVGPYLANAALGPRGPEPTHFREDFRRRGPSNYSHGKQANLSHV
jgi:hypothetical protein